MLSGLSLAEQIAQLQESAPVEYDPEDFQQDGGQGDTGTDENLRAHYIETGLSTLRNALPSVPDTKYEGIRISRQELMQESADDSLSEGSSDLEGEEQHSAKEVILGRETASDQEGHSQEGSVSEGPKSPEGDHPERIEGTESTQRSAKREDVQKGHAIKRQIKLWDTLLDVRIRLQKSVVTTNRLPPPATMEEYWSFPDCKDAMLAFLEEAADLTDALNELEEDLSSTNKIMDLPSRKRRRQDSELTENDYADYFIATTDISAAAEESLHPYTIQTLNKWSAKIQAVAPSTLLPSRRGTFMKGNQTPKPTVDLITEVLEDHGKLLDRTRILRTKKPRIGVAGDDLVELQDPEIFDDTDFYQKMLRDIIDTRSSGGEDWMVLQKQKKAKKKVDTKASKGRKLRYEIHEKIQNFMVPVPVHGAWHEEQVDELFASILGKGFEDALHQEESHGQESVDITGFRVFG